MEEHTQWNLTPLFSSDIDPKMAQSRIEWTQATQHFIDKWRNRIDFCESPLILKEALDDYETWARCYGPTSNEGYYFWLRLQQDQTNAGIKAKLNKIDQQEKKLVADTQFFPLKLSHVSKEKQSLFLKDENLRSYWHFLERLWQQAEHVLSEPEERMMLLKSESSYSAWVKLVSELLTKEEATVLDVNGNSVKKQFTELLTVMSLPLKEVRDVAAKEFNRILEKHAPIAEAELNAILGDKKVNDELRKYSRPDMEQYLNDDIDSQIVDTLLQTVESRFEIAHRYYRLKAALLGLPSLKYHERNIEYGENIISYSYEEAVQIVDKAFKKLDSSFSLLFNQFLQEGKIDVMPKKGKTVGAFCAHGGISQPVYILLNFSNSLRDVETIAHEMGHAINNECMKKKCDGLSYEISLATAEVPSTFMEDFVLQEVLEKSDDQTRLAMLMQKLNGDIGAIIRQIACYRFEQELHRTFREKGFLSKEEIGALFQKHMAAYMGPAVEMSPGSENWWVYWGHIRRFFYVYSYSSGLMISKALQNAVKKDPTFIEKVKVFLSTGTSKSPKDTFAELGIDITKKEFWNQGLDEIESLLNEAESLAKSLGKIK